MPKVFGDAIVVDDDKGICEVIKTYLEELGFFRHIVIANDGALASSKLSNQKFALILLDINMPKKSGLDILSDLDRSSLNKVESVLIISGELAKHTLSVALDRGAKNFLTKPFDQESFKVKVVSTLKNSFKKEG